MTLKGKCKRWLSTNFPFTLIIFVGIKEYEITNGNAQKEYSQLFTDEEKIEMAVEVAKVFHVLKEFTDFFSEFDIDDNENIFKNIYLKNLNNMNIKDFNVQVHIQHSLMLRVTTIGNATYNTLSLFNHACNENVMVFFYGASAVVKAIRSIKRGEQCFMNYG